MRKYQTIVLLMSLLVIISFNSISIYNQVYAVNSIRIVNNNIQSANYKITNQDGSVFQEETIPPSMSKYVSLNSAKTYKITIDTGGVRFQNPIASGNACYTYTIGSQKVDLRVDSCAGHLGKHPIK